MGAQHTESGELECLSWAHDFLICLSAGERRVFVSRPANRLAEALSRKITEELHAKDLRAHRNLILIEKTIHI